jgi:hypothetical protein
VKGEENMVLQSILSQRLEMVSLFSNVKLFIDMKYDVISSISSENDESGVQDIQEDG